MDADAVKCARAGCKQMVTLPAFPPREPIDVYCSFGCSGPTDPYPAPRTKRGRR